MSPHVLELLLRELDVDPHDVVTVPGPARPHGAVAARRRGPARTSRTSRSGPPRTPPSPSGETAKSVFATLREGDVLVHHPYDSFSTSVQRFVEQAAADQNVLAIKQTLYRTSGDSPIVDALKDAAAAGKQVVALVEIKARFDEQANIRWARELERAGVHVVYGLVGPEDALQDLPGGAPGGQTRSGATATSAPATTTRRPRDCTKTWGCSPPIRRSAKTSPTCSTRSPATRARPSYQSLLVAPYGVRRGIVRRIEDEIEAHREGKDARIRIKVNSLVDEQVIDALYRASQAGVPVDIVVRGICAHPARAGGAQREHPRPLDPRALPRALAGVPLRRGRRVLDRQRGHDAPQPGPARRGAAAGGRPEARHVPARRCSTRASTPRRGAGRSRRTARGGRRRRRTPVCRRCATTRPR